MKIDRLETHDRFQHFTKGEFDISATCQTIINKRPFGEYPFYIFAHKRDLGADERFNLWMGHMADKPIEQVPSTRLIWQPRLTKPKAQENSMLFKGYPGSDIVKVIWIIPQKELWEQFEKGKMTESNMIWESIDKFKNRKEELEAKEKDDLPDDIIDSIYTEISKEAKWKTI